MWPPAEAAWWPHRRRTALTWAGRVSAASDLCGEEVDKTIPTPHPDSAEIDEIIPISKGGDPLSRTNTQLVHRHCNRTKSDRLPDEHAPAPRVFETHLTW